MLDRVTPITSVVAHVREMHGKIPLAIVSGSPRDSIIRTLTTLGLLDFFDTLVGSEDYTNGKPNPEPFLTAAKRYKYIYIFFLFFLLLSIVKTVVSKLYFSLNVDPKDCLVFEDADSGIKVCCLLLFIVFFKTNIVQSAEAAGMKWARVPVQRVVELAAAN